MNMRYAFLADVARVENGKLYVLGGGFTIVHARQFPATLRAWLAVGIDYNDTEIGAQHTLRLHLGDADGTGLFPDADLSFVLAPRSEHVPKRTPLHLPIAIELPQSPIIPEAGSYSLELLVDTYHIGSVPFVVAEAPTLQAAA